MCLLCIDMSTMNKQIIYTHTYTHIYETYTTVLHIRKRFSHYPPIEIPVAPKGT